MLKKEVLYSLNDVTIIPATISNVRHRSQCYPFLQGSLEGRPGEYYPIIAAPMSSVVSLENYKSFHDARISCIIPRTTPIEERLKLCTEVMCAFSLSEVEEEFIYHSYRLMGQKLCVLIDIANGHMKKEIEVGKKLKDLYGSSIVLMGGNIANPETYLLYDDAGFDYVRCGIGGGSQCLTSTQTGIHYPMASLISDTFNIIRMKPRKTKIIADGGINTYSDIIKCLALGADYVMSGKIFAKAEEACGPTYVMYDEKSGNPRKFRRYYGMSTKKAQAEILGFKTVEDAKKENIKLKTSEGRSEDLMVEYTLQGWADNFNSYIRSAMSYTNSLTLDDFKHSDVKVISPTTGMLINNK